MTPAPPIEQRRKDAVLRWSDARSSSSLRAVLAGIARRRGNTFTVGWLASQWRGGGNETDNQAAEDRAAKEMCIDG